MSDECNIDMYHKKAVPFRCDGLRRGAFMHLHKQTHEPTQTTPRHSSTNVVVACCLSPQKGHPSVYRTITKRRAFCALTF